MRFRGVQVRIKLLHESSMAHSLPRADPKYVNDAMMTQTTRLCHERVADLPPILLVDVT